MPGKEIFPARKASTAISLAALTTAGIPPPAASAARARPTAGIALRFEVEEVEPADFDEVEPAEVVAHPLGIRKRVEDRELHVVFSELGHERAVHELDQGMDDGLGMDHDVDLLGRRARRGSAPR